MIMVIYQPSPLELELINNARAEIETAKAELKEGIADMQKGQRNPFAVYGREFLERLMTALYSDSAQPIYVWQIGNQHTDN